MGIRQYIGARYTPRFVGTHNITSIYEALDVVDNGMGTTYIAKKPVPAGTPLTDTDFWLVYGSSSGAILDLQTRVGALENEIPDIESDINVLRGVGRMWYIGDSFLGLADNWGAYLDTYLGKSDTYVTYEGGIGFVDPGNGTGLNLGQKIAALTDVPDDIDIVVVVAGCNDCITADAGDYNNFYTQLGNCATQIKAQAPNARKIIFAFNGTWQDPSLTNYSDAVTYIGDVYRMINNRIPEYSKCCVCKSVASQLQTSILVSDGIHPTAVGSMAIAKCLANFITGGGESTVNYRREVSPIEFEICNLEYISASIKTGATYAFSGDIAANSYTYLTNTPLQLPYFPRWNGQLRVPFERCNITYSGGTGVLLNSHIIVRSDGKISIFNPNTAFTGVTNLSFSCGGPVVTAPMFTQLHT